MLERFVAIYADVMKLVVDGELNPDPRYHEGKCLKKKINHKKITVIIDDERAGIDDFITPDEKKKIEKYVSVLRPLADFVKAVEGEKYPTIAFAPVLLGECLRQLQPIDGDDNELNTLKRCLHLALHARLGRMLTGVNLAVAAAAVHPALGHLHFISDELRAQVLCRI